MSVFEFIGGEHTAKNVMLTASKRPIGRESSGAEIEDLRARLRQLSAEFGVERQALAHWMGEALGVEADGAAPCSQQQPRRKEKPMAQQMAAPGLQPRIQPRGEIVSRAADRGEIESPRPHLRRTAAPKRVI